MGKFIMEICCGSAEDVIEAQRAGADRVELNSDLFHGGITPSVGELIVAKKSVNIPIMTMVRPRQGGFCYNKTDFATAMADAEQFLLHGADGLVFGFLHEDGSLDVEKCREIVSLAGSKQTVFHRAIDVASDWRRMLEKLIELGVTRVLTSGQEPSTIYGMETIRQMIEFAEGRIQILPGGGINLQNVQRIVAETGCTQVHLHHGRPQMDLSTANNRSIFFGGALYPPEDRYDVVDTEYLSQVRHLL